MASVEWHTTSTNWQTRTRNRKVTGSADVPRGTAKAKRKKGKKLPRNQAVQGFLGWVLVGYLILIRRTTRWRHEGLEKLDSHYHWFHHQVEGKSPWSSEAYLKEASGPLSPRRSRGDDRRESLRDSPKGAWTEPPLALVPKLLYV